MTHRRRTRFAEWAARACALAIAAASPAALAQSQQPDPPGQPASPAQSAPSQQPEHDAGGEQPAAAPTRGWVTESTPGTAAAPDQEEQEVLPPLDARPPVVLSQEQIALIGRINAYLNDLKNVEGRFIQTDHRNEVKRGRFYVKRPGRLRFDYASPSMMRVVADGEYLSVEDHDLKTVDKYPLDATPIQLLLGEGVDLLRDAVILDMRQDETAVVIVLKDNSGNSSGYLQLFFRLPEIELYEWVITDAQGLDTRIQLADLVAGKEKSAKFFESSSIELQKLWNN